jgi:hypothetical protein
MCVGGRVCCLVGTRSDFVRTTPDIDHANEHKYGKPSGRVVMCVAGKAFNRRDDGFERRLICCLMLTPCIQKSDQLLTVAYEHRPETLVEVLAPELSQLDFIVCTRGYHCESSEDALQYRSHDRVQNACNL